MEINLGMGEVILCRIRIWPLNNSIDKSCYQNDHSETHG